ncbi:MAG: leucyl aminopeptidase [Gammaproteobacteria bacterium]|nr:leucyl aminopeptidase [Gammaproteobacteria bacterium]
MEFKVAISSPVTQETGCLVLTLFKNSPISGATKEVDEASGGYLTNILNKGDVDGSVGKPLMLYNVPALSAERVLLVGCGETGSFDAQVYKKVINSVIGALKDYAIKEACLYVADNDVLKRDKAFNLRYGTQLVEEALFRSGALKSKQDEDNTRIATISWGLLEAKNESELQEAISQGHAIGLGVNYARDLGDLPGNICTPTFLAKQGMELGKESKTIKTTVLEEDDMEELGMGSLLSVSRGSRQPAKLIVMEYSGADSKQAPIVLVGKGLTFDAGGVSLKPGEGMDEMKYDMCGAASVFGVMKMLSIYEPKINVIGVVPSSENLPDGAANKPGDIVTSMSGQTIEILNTDAEGRLILCDALTYTERFKPAVVVDIATLTGACVIALGKVASGLFTNDEALAQELLDSGNRANDRVWRMPLWDDYQEQLKSNFADMQNIGGREAGSVTAACFLARFTKAYRWAHLDIAGTAWLSGAQKGATGRPVPLLSQFVLNHGHHTS